MSSLIYPFCIQLIVIQVVYSQCANRIVQGPNGPIELLPNQVFVPPGVPYFGPLFPPGPSAPQGRPVLIQGPPQPAKSPAQPILVPGAPAFPAEYTNIPNLGPVITNFVPYSSAPAVISGNAPNVASGLPNIVSGLPNIVSGLPNIVSGLPNIVSANPVVSNAASAVLPAESYPPTIVHDSSVANSLANALQLLVVSNLIGSTLPGPYDVYNIPPYNYIY